jgi:pSer/pThr/pTyr-binding forkhead associated (FHA) protein
VIVATGAVLPLPGALQAVVGRADPVSQFFPDVDMTPHGALDQGVGRRHARLFIATGQVMLEDLDSTNGTLLNGRRLAARQPEPLRDGDQITFGKMAVRYSEH